MHLPQFSLTACAIFRFLSPSRVASAASKVLDLVLPKLRRVARINLSFAYPQLDSAARERIIDGVFRNIARLLLALSRFPDLNAANINDWIGYEGLENYLAAKRAGRGVLIATAHLGNWELSAFAHALLTEAMNVMVRPLDNPLIDQLVEARRVLSGNRLIYKRDGARAVLRALRNNEAVGHLDRSEHRSRRRRLRRFLWPARLCQFRLCQARLPLASAGNSRLRGLGRSCPALCFAFPSGDSP